MDRHHRAPVATFFSPRFAAGEPAALNDGAAHHARVKRLAAGDSVRLTDGAGQRGVATILTVSRDGVMLDVHEVDHTPQPRVIHLRVPVADRDRMLWLAEKATEIGIASWQAVRFRRSMSVSPRGEGEAFAAKLRARMINALEQCGGAWLPAMLPDISVEHLAESRPAHAILLDATGVPIARMMNRDADRAPTMLIGPEGGLEPDEYAALDTGGWRRARLAANTLRFETAGVAAAAIYSVLNLPEEM